MSSGQKQNLIGWSSIALSGVIFIIFIILKIKLVVRHISTSGKSLGFDGLDEFLLLFNSWWPLFGIFGAMVLSIYVSKQKEDSKLVAISFLTSFFLFLLWYWPFVSLLF